MNHLNEKLVIFEVEELENRLENRWCTTTVVDGCTEEVKSTSTERC